MHCILAIDFDCSSNCEEQWLSLAIDWSFPLFVSAQMRLLTLEQLKVHRAQSPVGRILSPVSRAPSCSTGLLLSCQSPAFNRDDAFALVKTEMVKKGPVTHCPPEGKRRHSSFSVASCVMTRWWFSLLQILLKCTMLQTFLKAHLLCSVVRPPLGHHSSGNSLHHSALTQLTEAFPAAGKLSLIS